MQADEIRARIDHFRETTKATVKEVIGSQAGDCNWITARILAEQAVYQGEIALQLAELNANLKAMQLNGTLAVTPCQGDEVLVKVVG